jgi:hypothetical protein
MTWQRQLDDALRELARTADEIPENPATEQRLMEAFDTRAAVQARAARTRTSRATWYLAAAASLALLAGGWWAGAHLRDGGGTRATPSMQLASASPAVRPSSQASPAPQALASAPPEAPAVAASHPRAPLPLAPSAEAQPRATRSRAEAADEADEFVALPAADRLPRFESGMIVRVELDGASLPAFGFPIMPDGARTPIAADVLVGQDGQPRAIRLVSMQSRTRSYR